VPVKRLAVLYTPGEKNTEFQLIELQNIQANSQIKVIPIILTNKEGVAYALSEVVHAADAIYLTGSSIVGATVPKIVDMANKSKVVTITHLDDLVEKGALLGICANSYLVGRLAGKKAGNILKGAKPSSIPIEPERKVDVILNKKTAKAGQFQIPSSFMNKVTKTIE
jgi:putative ABC transport system substrate-binding protein